jgi:hypothetical protein
MLAQNVDACLRIEECPSAQRVMAVSMSLLCCPFLYLRYDGCGTKGVLPERGVAWKERKVEGQLEGKKVVAFDSGTYTSIQQQTRMHMMM